MAENHGAIDALLSENRVFEPSAEFRARAFIRCSSGTKLGTSDWRTGIMKAQATPVTAVKAKRCQTRR